MNRTPLLPAFPRARRPAAHVPCGARGPDLPRPPRRPAAARWAWPLALLLAAGCAADSPATGDPAEPDVLADAADSGAPDVSPGDAADGASSADGADAAGADGLGPDAGPPDAAPDAGVEDAATPDADAAVPDTSPDADAAVPDTSPDADAAVPDTSPDAADAGAEPPPPNALAGRIQVIQQVYEGAPGSAYATAALWAAPPPSSQVVVAEGGDCRKLVGSIDMPWACDPECEWGKETCIDGACVAWPDRAPVGTITLGGLAAPVTLKPAADGSYEGAYGLPAAAFTDGAPVTATAPGDVGAALALEAAGVEPLVAAPGTWHFEPGEDYTVTWEPGSGAARIQLLVETGWHGSPNLTTIWCETEDDGELVVPASLTDGFPIPSCGECEGSTLSRFTRDLTGPPGAPVELFVASQVWFVAWWGN